jgi:hypothetical protein
VCEFIKEDHVGLQHGGELLLIRQLQFSGGESEEEED